MMNRSPLELPEIRYLIGLLLSRKELFYCAQVSHNWKASFEPLIWRTLCLDKGFNDKDTRESPSVSAIEKHAHYVQFLTLPAYPCSIILSHPSFNFKNLCSIKVEKRSAMRFPALRSVKSRDTNQEEESKYGIWLWSDIIPALIRENSQLSKVEICCTSIHSMPSTVSWEAMLTRQTMQININDPLSRFCSSSSSSSSSRIKSLKLTTLQINDDDLDTFWKACRKTDKLQLQSLCFKRYAGLYFSTPEKQYATEESTDNNLYLNSGCHYDIPVLRCPITSRPSCFIKTLELFRLGGLALSEQLAIIRQCPLLESLHWHPYLANSIINDADELPNMAEAFIQLVKSKAWPCLNLLDAEWLSLSDEQWSCFLEVIPSGKLKKVHAIRSGFGQLAFEQLMNRHKLSVRVLDLDECEGVTSRMLIVILKNCLCLEELGAVMIKVDDIEGQVEGLEIKDSSRWICNQLKSLRIQFDMVSESTAASRFASSQCSSTSLTLLPLEYPEFEYSHQIVFRQLVALTQLETLHVRENRGSSNQFQLRYGFNALRQLPELKSLVIGKDMKCFGKENIVQLLVNNPQT